MNGKKEKRKGTKNEENTSAKQWDGSEISNVSINTQLFVSSFDYTTSQGRPREDNYFHVSKFLRVSKASNFARKTVIRYRRGLKGGRDDVRWNNDFCE